MCSLARICFSASPFPFSKDKIEVIKDENNDDFFSQCRTALDMSMKEFGTEAKQPSVIQTMRDIEQRARAVKLSFWY